LPHKFREKLQNFLRLVSRLLHKSGAISNNIGPEILQELIFAMPTDPPRLYLITPPISDWAAYASLFEAPVMACGVACVLLRTTPALSGEGANEDTLRELLPLLQKHGVACLVADDPELAVHVNADGVHLEDEGAELQSAVRSLQPAHIVGAGGLKTRDAAMAAGEAGVDYVMFGGPDSGEPQESITEHVNWWAEIFNVPCVGYALELSAIGDLVRAGADFIALGDAVFADPRGAATALSEAARLLSPAPEAVQ
jgi:thiamine-phosphate pyrophosphorylase